MSPNTFDTSTETFDRDVIDASRAVPVIVDFWAPWCAPCRVLKPILEQLAIEYGGKFRLAKLNTDEHQELAAKFGVRGIPNVKAFVDGRVAHEFTGALPESAVRAFLAKVIPSPAERLRAAARDLVAVGEFEGAEAKLNEALVLDVGLISARLDLAQLLVARQDFERGAEVLAHVAEAEQDERYAKLIMQIEAWQKAQALPTVSELVARLERDPENPQLRFDLAERLIAEMQFEAALDELIGVVRITRGAARDEARKAMLRVFSLAADQTELVSQYRRLLAAALN